MAKLIQAIRNYGPRVEYNNTIQLGQVADWISTRTTLNNSEVAMVLQELHNCILYFNKYGAPVKLPGLGRFAPSVDRNGNYRINVSIDNALRDEINTPRAFTGSVANRGNVGLDNDSLKALWDADHPDDPLEL